MFNMTVLQKCSARNSYNFISEMWLARRCVERVCECVFCPGPAVIPTRAPGIHILGTSAVTRVAVNALIAFAALFAKNKVIARVAFSSVAELARRFGAPNLPEIHGGDARAPTAAWVEERLRTFPRMDLPAYSPSS